MGPIILGKIEVVLHRTTPIVLTLPIALAQGVEATVISMVAEATLVHEVAPTRDPGLRDVTGLFQPIHC